MIIDCISDLHGFYPKLEGADLLIVAGDLTKRDDAWEYVEFGKWINKQSYKKKIVIAGNHDNIAQKAEPFINPGTDEWIYLCDSGTEFEGLKIWGSPWTLAFEGMNPKCKAFTCETEEELAEKWALIPDDIDILITHGPPYGILDKVKIFDYPDTPLRIGKFLNSQYEYVGSKSLLEILDKIRPSHMIFGHIHEGGGKKIIYKRPGYGDENNTTCINCSHVNERYQPVNKPVRIFL